MNCLKTLRVVFIIWWSLSAGSDIVFSADMIRVGLHDSRPLSFVDSDNSLSGIYPDVIREIARRQGWRIQLRTVSRPEGLEQLRNGELDLLGPIGEAQARQQRLRLNREPVIVDWGQVYLPRTSAITSLPDLNNKTIAYPEGDAMYQRLAERLRRFGIEAESVPVKDPLTVFRMVSQGQVDAGAVNRLFGVLNMKRFGLKESPVVYSPLAFCFAASPLKESSFSGLLDLHLKAMKEDTASAYPEILDKYLVRLPESSGPGALPSLRQVMLGCGLVLAILLVMIAWAISLKITVGRRARELARSTGKLRSSNRLLNAVMEATTDAIFVKDLSGRYILANSAACSALGKPPDRVVGKTDGQLFPKASADIIVETDARVLKTCQPILSEEKLETAYGEETWWLTNKGPYKDEDNTPIGVIGISKNITEIKQAQIEKERLETELRQAHKMEAIGTLAGGIAHDFNNILGIVLGNSELAMEEISDSHPVKENLSEIKIAALRARDVVRQLLSFSRKGARGQKIIFIQSILRECMKLLRSSLPATIDIHLDVDEDTLPVVANPIQIHQVILNLCTNAAHAMEETGGTLTIHLENTAVAASDGGTDGAGPSGPYVSLAIKDTGTGIAPEIRDRIFEPYFTTKEVGHGTGIGLSVVHGIVKNQGGFIRMESQPGNGTTMSVLFPASRRPQPEEDAETQAVIPGRGMVLLVDDEPSMVKMGSDMLERLGYRVTGMTDPECAVQRFSENPNEFDLIITDLTMPKLTGQALSDRARQIRPDIPVILTTGFSSKVENQNMDGHQMDGILEKPFDGKTLSHRVSDALAGRGGR